MTQSGRGNHAWHQCFGLGCALVGTGPPNKSLELTPKPVSLTVGLAGCTLWVRYMRRRSSTLCYAHNWWGIPRPLCEEPTYFLGGLTLPS